MATARIISNVHGVEEFTIVAVPESDKPHTFRRHQQNIPALASTVQKTKHWIRDLMHELQWDDAPKTYHGLSVVLHALRDRLTVHETADLAAQLPMLLRGLFYEGWKPDRVPVKDRTQEAFLTHVFKAFTNDPSVDPEQLTRAVFAVLAAHVSRGQIDDIRAILPPPLRELFDKA